ncbi:PREDICTED: E3 ubiquitin-protein ligase DTX3L-like [Nanorana parkeri]|uniref:E3 ubiquitin-protein ligase DTX3L-like n=1 Tax=Nanorana parkeri TaxID=125878 RepID=UPI000854E891|nr:PREDICTED: E3 ubiquitin-protein ligase DTX3L-like [Nanorana parkeri]
MAPPARPTVVCDSMTKQQSCTKPRDQRRVLRRGNHIIEFTVPVTVHDISRGDLARIRQCSGDGGRMRVLQQLAASAGNTQSDSAGNVTDDKILPEHGQVCFPSALYEYIMEIYRTEVDVIERRHGVKIDHRSSPGGNTVVSFIPLGPDSSPEKAREIYTDKLQKVMGDWSQERVDPSGVPLTFSDIKQRVKDRWRKILVLQEGNTDIILRGPRDELSQAIQFLKKDDYKPARPRRAPTISSGDIRTEIPVDVRHMDILKKLKSREISDIERKYNVKMDEVKKNGGVLVTFRAIDATPDLSPHASYSFTTLLQKTFFNIEKKLISVKPEFQEERVSVLQEELMMRGVDIVMEYSSGSVLLIGHPVHVAFAAGELSGSQNSGREGY